MALVCLRDYEEKAAEMLAKGPLDYYRTGAGQMITLRNNRESYQRLLLRPKCLQNVSQMDITTNILGMDVKMPVGIAPSAVHKLANEEGELATARAAAKAGVIYIQSNGSNYSIEEVAEAAPDATKWFQVYFFAERKITENLVRRVENCGYKAIVLTVDSPQPGSSYAHKRNKWHPPPHVKWANHLEPLGIKATQGFDTSLTWEEGVKWLVNFTKLPVIAKGVLRADDALKAIEAGCKGVIVSNHGGRNVDTTPATIDVLPEIVKAVAGRVPVMIDGGITLGTDVIKAIAFGAQMVFMGRPIIWGLTVKGQEGVEEVLKLIHDELNTAMMLCGTPSLKDITRDLVVHPSYYVDKLLKLQSKNEKKIEKIEGKKEEANGALVTGLISNFERLNGK